MPEGTLSSEPVEPTELRETVIMAALTVVAGAVDAISFLTMGHVFAALTTGNLLFMSFAMAGEGQVPVARPAAALIMFAFGVAVTSAVAHRLTGRERHWFPAALGAEALLLGAAGALALWQHGTGSLTYDPDLGVIAIVGFAMGARAATMLLAGVPEMPTLLVQMSLVKLVADVVTKPQALFGEDAAPQRLGHVRLATTVGGMILGGALGTLMVPWGTGRALLAVAAAVLLLSAVHLLARRPPDSGGATETR